ncbi:MAG: arginine--tRNA ligase, partial [Nanoarchaeota archaeon]
MDFRYQLIALLHRCTSLSMDEIAQRIAVPPDPALGDYAFPCFKLDSNAHQAAQNLKSKISLPSYLSKIDVAGPYLNFYLDPAVVAEQTIAEIKKQKDRYGAGKEKKKVVVEFCSPNTNKPLHLGHIRNMAIGDAVCRLLAFQGNTVHPVSVVNDRGIHICQSMLGYQKWGNHKKPDKKSDHFVCDYYVLFAKHAKEDENVKNEAQELLLKWERNDKSTRALWKKMNGWVLKGFAQTYKRFGIRFEKEYFESTYYQDGKEVVLEGLKRGIFEKDHTDAVTALLEMYDLPNKVLLRGDETSLYITQDLYLAGMRYKDYKFDQMIYVVASEQNLHFRQLFKILELLGRPYARQMYHLSYGLVNLPTGRMKSREGTVVDADNLIDEVASLAEQEVQTRYALLSEKKRKYRAEFIALGAIKFFVLRTDPNRDMIFNPEESISFDGETGPYIQYTHARACSILRKAGTKPRTVQYSLLDHLLEQRVLKLLAQFPERAQEVSTQYKIHLLCRYLLDLSQAFNEFYQECPVLKADKEIKNARLALVDASRQVLKNGLYL